MTNSGIERTTATVTTQAQDSAGTAKPCRIEAHGVKGMQSRPWRRTFKDPASLLAWCEKNSAEVYGTRDAE
jgi:hypothetical protein